MLFWYAFLKRLKLSFSSAHAARYFTINSVLFVLFGFSFNLFSHFHSLCVCGKRLFCLFKCAAILMTFRFQHGDRLFFVASISHVSALTNTTLFLSSLEYSFFFIFVLCFVLSHFIPFYYIYFLIRKSFCMSQWIFHFLVIICIRLMFEFICACDHIHVYLYV